MNKFIRSYLNYTANTETPEHMHLWCAISSLAGACERRVWLDRGMFHLYGNMYIVLVAPPGVAAKTTSLGYCTKMLQETGFNVVDMVATKEKIVEDMYQAGSYFAMPNGEAFPHTSITFSMSELNTLLTAGQDMVLFLTSIWDKNDVYTYKTKTSGEFDIVNPYFNMIGAATTEWFQKATNTDMLSSGFLARCILVYADKKRMRVSKPSINEEQKDALAECKRLLAEISTYFGEIKMSAAAEKHYGDWYNNLPDSQLADPRIAGYLERKAKTFILKLAMLLAIGDLRHKVELDDIKNAILIFDKTEPALKQCLLLLGENKNAEYLRTMVRLLLNAKDYRMLQTEVFKMFYANLDTDTVVKIFAALRAMDLIAIKNQYVELTSAEQARIFIENPVVEGIGNKL